MYRVRWLLLLLTYALILFPYTTHAQDCPAPNWSGSYFNNADFTGTPAARTCDPVVDFHWGADAPQPGFEVDNFSARWTSIQTFETPGDWQFTLIAEDGVRLSINGSLLINEMSDMDVPRTLTANHTTTTENEPVFITVEVNNYTGNAEIALAWTPTGQAVPPPGGGQPWAIQYFNSPDLSGGLIATESFPPDGISRNYMTNAPAVTINPDNWSARWTRLVTFPEGEYVFTARADDTFRVVIDDVQILGSTQLEEGKTYRIAIFIAAGVHEITVEHRETDNNANLFLTWEPPIGTILLPSGCNGATAGINGSEPPCSDQPQAASVGSTPPPAPVVLPVMVQAGPLNFRAEPSQDAESLDMISQGEQYTAYGRSADNIWLQLEVEGVRGWSMSEFLTLNGDINQLSVIAGSTIANAPIVPTATSIPVGVQARALGSMRLRSGAGIAFERTGSVRYDTLVTVIGRNMDATWIKIEVNGIQGWAAMAWYQITAGDVSTLPIIEQ